MTHGHWTEIVAAYDRGDLSATDAINAAEALSRPDDDRVKATVYSSAAGIRVISELIKATELGYVPAHTTMASIAGVHGSTFKAWRQAEELEVREPRLRVFAAIYARLQGKVEASTLGKIAETADARVRLQQLQGVRREYSEKQHIRPAQVNVNFSQQNVFDSLRARLNRAKDVTPVRDELECFEPQELEAPSVLGSDQAVSNTPELLPIS